MVVKGLLKEHYCFLMFCLFCLFFCLFFFCFCFFVVVAVVVVFSLSLENLAFRLPWIPIKISDLDKIHIVTPETFQ